MKRLSSLLLASVLLVAACTSGSEPTTTTQPPATTAAAPATTATSQPATTTSSPGAMPAAIGNAPFGILAEVALLTDETPYAGPDHPSSLDGVLVADWIDDYLAANGAVAQLTSDGFVVVPSNTRQFHHVYESAEYGGYPVFVTTDAAYHVWHLAFDKILRETEQQTLLPELERMVQELVALSRAQEEELAGTDLAEPAGRVTQFYEAAATLLDLDVGEIGPLAAAEVELAEAAAGIAVSPTIGIELESDFITVKTDYSLFRPRGHYTRNADLKRYFAAMSQLGNNAFLLEPETLQLGILASRVLLANPDIVAQWQKIYEPTAFLVGAADDYTPFELSGVVEAVIPSGWEDPTAFTDLETVAQIGSGLRALRPVAINPEAASVRVMGTRLVVDSYIFDQLVMPNVPDRWTASPLDLAASFGSDWAYDQLVATGQTDFPGYDEQLSEMQDLLADRTIDDWGRTVYDSWLYAVEPMWQSHGPAFPDFMRTPAWEAKAHQTGFGSYTELKHDTILYTKQAVAEGGGEEPPVPPRHWVEPDPVVFQRLGAAAALLRVGLDSRALLPDEYSDLLLDLESLYTWLGGIAEDELAGRPISQDDNDQLSWIGGALETFWVRTSDAELDLESGPDAYAALVADIMRNVNSILELGTGYVDNILVLVPNDEGTFQVAIGGVFSYYEFWIDDGQRLTDEEWRAMLDAGTAPERPTWQSVFLAGEPPPPAPPTGLEPGLFCRDVAARGYDFWTAAVYWVSEGSPDRMDADGNGIPCETVFPGDEIDGFLDGGRTFASGLSCATLDLVDDPDTYLRAIAYWMLEGAPDRMDADGDGIPCETVFSAANIEIAFGFFGG